MFVEFTGNAVREGKERDAAFLFLTVCKITLYGRKTAPHFTFPVGQKGDLALLSTQEMLAVDAPRRHKVSVHVLAREMDSCKY